MGTGRSAGGSHGHRWGLLEPVRPGRPRPAARAQRGHRAEGAVRAADRSLEQLLHVWKSLLEKAGFTLEDIPKQWDAFWSFWCDRVQPAVRKATGRDDIWGIALNMSVEAPGETDVQFTQFVDAYGADYVTRDGRLVIDDPEVRQKLIRAMDSYTAIYRKGCTPPNSVIMGR